ncbi:MAG: response regulator [Patescibacteria group bacterium]
MAKQILLVEDDQFLATLLKMRLKKEGFAVMVARDGNEALEALKKTKFDLVLMDIILPGKSGFEAMEQIVANPQYGGKTPIMIISNLGQESDVNRGKELGAVEYFVKAQTPIDTLVEKIRNFLNK